MHKEDVKFQAHLLKNNGVAHDIIHGSDWRQFLYMGKDEQWYPLHETKALDGINSPVLYTVGEGDKGET